MNNQIYGHNFIEPINITKKKGGLVSFILIMELAAGIFVISFIAAALNDTASASQVPSESSDVPSISESTTTIEEAPQVSSRPPLESFIAESTADTIEKWKPRVAYIECSWARENEVLSGSGFLFSETTSDGDNTEMIITNRHIIENGTDADFCMVVLPDDEKVFVIYKEDFVKNPTGADMAFLNLRKGYLFDLSTGSSDPVNQNSGFITQAAINNSYFNECNTLTDKPRLGEEIIVLGYPGIGSQDSMTATKGMISGYDGDYYITDAKIEHGNSGGIAISVKNSCYLGIPTDVRTGEMESFGRIMDVEKVINDMIQYLDR